MDALLPAQTRNARTRTRAVKEPTAQDLLRGSYGPYRANNDLLFYHLDLRVDPEKKFITGTNTIRFKMLEDGTRIQLELFPTLQIDKINMGSTILKYDRDGGTFYVDFPSTLSKGKTYSIDVHYSGNPTETGRFGCFSFKKDPSGHPWITTACEGDGAYVWWPNKEQWRDEPQEGMLITIAVPNGLMDVSNGKFMGKKDLGDGYTRWDWRVHYPINNYDVALNIGNYTHFDDKFQGLALDYYVLPEDLEGAKRQFAQVPGMMKAYYHYLGEYPFKKDGYKLVDVPYSGMEHQTAVSYGNHFANGYLNRDWTGVGISTRFDFIIIHESGHEWFGNAITAADKSDMWIHEGWTTYLESLYVEYTYGHDDAMKYLNAYKKKVKNDRPIISARGTNAEPPQDQYFKGALFINTLRSIVNDDAKWWPMLRGYYQKYKYQNIMTEDIISYFNQQMGMDLNSVFRQYLWHTAIPTLELKFDEAGTLQYRWQCRRESLQHAHPRRLQRALGDNPSHDRLADHEDATDQGPVRGSDRSLLRQRQQVIEDAEGRRFEGTEQTSDAAESSSFVNKLVLLKGTPLAVPKMLDPRGGFSR